MSIANPNRHRLFYHCYDGDGRWGGQKSTYQHVDVLNQLGYEAYAVHVTPEYRLNWFPNDTRTLAWREVWRRFDFKTDVLVFPETYGSRIMQYPGKKVIFNKNLYLGFAALGDEPMSSDPYRHPDTLGVMVVSEHNQQHLQFAYPDLPICKVVDQIDSSRFPFITLDKKKLQGVYIRKALPMLYSILHTFRARAHAGHNKGATMNWLAIENKTESEVSAILGESLIALFPHVEEGLGRFPIEALLSGCVVLSSNVGPMDEYVPASLRTEYGNVQDVVVKIENVIKDTCSNHGVLQDELIAARDKALAYNVDAQRKSVCAAWETFLGKM